VNLDANVSERSFNEEEIIVDVDISDTVSTLASQISAPTGMFWCTFCSMREIVTYVGGTLWQSFEYSKAVCSVNILCFLYNFVEMQEFRMFLQFWCGNHLMPCMEPVLSVKHLLLLPWFWMMVLYEWHLWILSVCVTLGFHRSVSATTEYIAVCFFFPNNLTMTNWN